MSTYNICFHREIKKYVMLILLVIWSYGLVSSEFTCCCSCISMGNSGMQVSDHSFVRVSSTQASTLNEIYNL